MSINVDSLSSENGGRGMFSFRSCFRYDCDMGTSFLNRFSVYCMVYRIRYLSSIDCSGMDWKKYESDECLMIKIEEWLLHTVMTLVFD